MRIPRPLLLLFLPLLALLAGIGLWSKMIDWEGHAKALAAEFAAASGYQLSFDADVEGRILPSPTMLLSQARVSKDGSASHLEAPLLRVPLAWSSLFGTAAPVRLEFIQAAIALEKNELSGMKIALPLPVQLEQASLTVTDQGAPSYALTPFTANVRMQEGVRLDATVTKEQYQASLAFTLAPGGAFTAALKDAAGGVAWEGNWQGGLAQPVIEGSVKASSTQWGPLLSAILPFWERHALTEMEPQAWELDGTLGYAEGRWNMQAALRAGEDRAALSLVLARQFAVTLDIDRLDADRWLATARQLWEARKKDAAQTPVGSLEQQIGVSQAGLLPPDAEGPLLVTAKEIQLHGQKVTDVTIQAALENGGWTLSQAKGLLPGNSQAELQGSVKETPEGWTVSGPLSVQGQSLRHYLLWLGVPLPEMAETLLGAFQGQATFAYAPLYRRLTEARLEVDGATVTGALLVKLPAEGPSPEIEGALLMQSVNLDPYFPPQRFLTEADVTGVAAPVTAQWLSQLSGRAQLALVARDISWRGMPVTQLQARLSLEQGKMEVQAFRAQVRERPLSGKFTLQPGELRPQLDLTLVSGPLRKEELEAFIAGGPVTAAAPAPAAEPATARWSQAPLDLSWLRLFNGSFDLAAQRFENEKWAVDNLRFKGQLADELLTVERFSGTLSNGAILLQGNLRGGSLPSFEGNFRLSDAEIGALLRLVLQVDSFTGKASITGSVKSNGVSLYSLVENMEATGNILLQDVTMQGFDLNSISRKVLAARTMEDVGALARQALESGSTKVNQMEAQFALAAHLLQFPRARLYTDYTEGGVQATIDVMHFLMNMKLSFTPKTVTDASVPPVHLLLQGNVETPKRQLDTTDLEAYIAKRAVRPGI